MIVSLPLAMSSLMDKPLKSVTHGQAVPDLRLPSSCWASILIRKCVLNDEALCVLNSGDGVRPVSAGRQGSQHLQAGEQTQNKPDKDRQDIQGLCCVHVSLL